MSAQAGDIEFPVSGPIDWAERGLIPDALIRVAIRRLLRKRLGDEHVDDVERAAGIFARRIEELMHSPLALETEAANRQHYEVPAAFYQACLGAHLKYSSALFADGDDLDRAERRMLEVTCQRAGLADGQRILELGCGWGSLTLWMAGQYSESRITAVSNSASQRAFILQRAEALGLDNVEVITCDVNRLKLDRRFDRVVSVEMFEHVRNYRELLARIAGWLEADGLLFVHIFCHRTLMYPFETTGDDDWMGRHFFTGGLMPAADTLAFFQHDLRLERRWLVNGGHYARTARAWLENLEARRDQARSALEPGFGAGVDRQLQRWRMFFMACEELFRFRGGNEWMVGHYLFANRGG